MTDSKKVVIRVYAIIFDQLGRLLVADESHQGVPMTKFPGGGLEWGEGILDCLRRECLEELGQAPNTLEHFYTTEFFQPSILSPDHQVVSVYYRAVMGDPGAIHAIESPNVIDSSAGDTLTLRWLPGDEISSDALTLPIDKYVAAMLCRLRDSGDDSGRKEE